MPHSNRVFRDIKNNQQYFHVTLLFSCVLIILWSTEPLKIKHIGLPVKGAHGKLKFNNREKNGEIWIENDTNSVSNMKSLFPEDLRKLRPSAFDAIPSEFLPEYKSPCYYGRDDRLHCLPYFFILGNPKCGTTEIWDWLAEHPHMNQGFKEMHWWTRYGFHGNQTLQRYEDVSFTAAIKRKSKHGVQPSDIITGDGSASTFWENLSWERLYPNFYDIGPPYVTADVIRALLPKSKLIVSLRDPTTRLYSDYIFFREISADKISPENFHRFALNEIDRFEACNRSRSERACAYSGYEEHRVRLRIGLYSIHMEDWLRAFPRNQLYVIKMEELTARCREILAELLEFLETAPLPDDRIEELCSEERSNVNPSRKRIGPMLNSTKARLRTFYRPYVVKLASVLQDKRFMWDY